MNGKAHSKYLLALAVLVLLATAATYSPQQSKILAAGQHGTTPGGTIILGNLAGTATDTGNQNVVVWTPIYLNDNASDYTMNAMKFNLATGAGNVNDGLYSSTTSGCPTGVGLCPGARVCQASSTVATTGDNNITPASCGTLTHGQYYWQAVIASSNSLVYNKAATTVCPGTSFTSMFATQGGFTLPATAASLNTIADCFRQSSTLNCVGACGNASKPYILFDFAGTNGTTVTPALFADGLCGNGAAGQNATPLTGLTFSNTVNHALNAPVIICGTSTSGSATSVLSWSTTGTPPKVVAYNFQPVSVASLAWYFRIDFDTTGDTTNAYSMGGVLAGGADFIVLQISNGQVRAECKANDSSNFTIAANTWYRGQVQFTAGSGTNGHKARIYDTSGTLLASLSCDATGTNNAGTFSFGISGAESEVTGHHIYNANAIGDATNGDLPLPN